MCIFADTTERIISAVCQEYGVKRRELFGRCRLRLLTEARQMTMYLVRHKMHGSLNEVGEVFGRDHATASYSINKIGGLLEYDRTTKLHYNNINKILNEQQQI